MKILLVSSFLPFPLTSGGHIRLYNLIKSLSDKHEITLVCEKRDHQSQEDIEEVEKICKKVLTVDRKKQWSAANILKTGFSTDPFLLVGHKSEEMKSLIRDELVRQTYDLIHVETFYVLQNVPRTSLPVVLIEHNVEYLVYKKYADLANPLARPLLYIDVSKIKRKEEKAWREADKLIAVSETEKRIMKRADTAIVPNGVDTKKFIFRSFDKIGDEKRVLFIGDFKWLQNRDALEFILKEIWPKVATELSQLNKKIDLKLWVVGKNIPEHLLKYESETIVFEKNQKLETPQIFRKSYLLLAPLRAGGGTSYKILEAMASGVGVVTTNLGIEGLGAENNVHVLAAQDPQNLANCVVNLLTDPSLYRKLTHNSRKFVEENYDWEKIAAKLEKVYMSAL
jgi:polysaccharide biosynthesis protein PslH